MDNKDICLFIGYAVNRDFEKNLTGISVAGNKMQINLLKELCERMDENICPITIYPVASFPTYRCIYINEHDEFLFTYKKNDKVDVITTKVPRIINIPIIKNLFEIFSTYNVAKRLAKQGNLKSIILFNCFPPTAYTALKLKKKYRCEIISLLADLPIDDSIKTKGLKSVFLNVFQKYTKKAIRKMDKLIVLNKEAANQYAPGVPYVVMEGAVDAKDITPFEYNIPVRKNIVFAGALQKYNGIVEVVEAMKLLAETDIELDIYGKGEFLDYVINAQKEFPNIRYKGVKDNEEIMQIQREAFLLINPRPSNDYIARVTFPSKMFEYMTSGTPVLSTHLNGYTKDFIDNLYIIEENTPQCIAETILAVSNKSDEELKSMAKGAFNMILQKKTWSIQAQRIIDFIKNK